MRATIWPGLAVLRSWAILAMLVSLPSAVMAQGYDYMGMVEQYNWNLQNTLQTEIMNDAGRRAMNLSRGRKNQTGRKVAATWPAHISERDVASRIFTVDELSTMRQANERRLRAMIDRKVISVQGTVKRTRGKNSFNVIGAGGEGQRVWAYWRRGFKLPADGSAVALRGVIDMRRRNSFTLSEARFINVPPPKQQPQQQAKTAPAAPSSSTDLRFTPDPSVTRKVNQQLAQAIAPALAPGRTTTELQKLFDSGQLQAAFRKILSSQNFSERDLGDVIAGHLIALWQVANDRQDINEPKGYQAIRSGIHGAMRTGGWAGQLSDAQKQTYAEIIGTGSMLVIARYIDAKQGNDAAKLALSKQDARQFVKKHAGMDLTQFDLNATGFAKRQ